MATTRTTRRLTPSTLRRTLPALAGLGLAVLCAGFALAEGGSGPASPSQDVPFRCGVFATQQSGMTVLQAVVESEAALGGSYRLAVTAMDGNGRNQINQAGPFVLGAAQSATLGSVTIGAGARADIVFELEIGGVTWTCSPAFA